MSILSRHKRVEVVNHLVEGCSIASTCRLVRVSKMTVLALLCKLGNACLAFHDQRVVNLACKRLEADEIWSFTYMKAKQATPADVALGRGDCWLWLAICAESRLIVSYYAGLRDEESARYFIQDVARRLTHRIQLTTDGLRWYVIAVEESFGDEIDFSQLIKDFISKEKSIEEKVIIGDPDPDGISTSYIERYNLTMRMCNRRYTRKTNGFSKKLTNHLYAIAIQNHYYNWCRVHMTLGTTPAIAAGISKRRWTPEDMVRRLLRDDEA